MSEQPIVRRAWPIVLGLFVGLALMGYFLIQILGTPAAQSSDTVAQVLWLTLSLILLLAALLATAVILRVVNPGPATTALGLPEGSISAVIALSLLILFSLSSVYVYTTILNGESGENAARTSTGLAIEDVRALPSDRVLQVTKESGSNPASYSVVVAAPHETSVEVGRTTLATISTLLIAIVGFYFGQRASEQGVDKGVKAAADKAAADKAAADKAAADKAAADKAAADKAAADKAAADKAAVEKAAGEKAATDMPAADTTAAATTDADTPAADTTDTPAADTTDTDTDTTDTDFR